MISFPGYQLKEKLYESINTVIYRALKDDSKMPVILKILKGEYPSPERIVRLRREYEIIRDLNIDGVIKTYGFESYSNSCAIVMEDFGAESLKKTISGRHLGLQEFLKFSVAAADIIGELHKLNIIHKNINSTNIVWNPGTGIVKIIDFGISTILSREVAAIQNPRDFEGTLSYISPEQTGRMNRMIDYRTDMYSLGVTLYEIMTGQLPFISDDPVELVHCHIAREPVSPAQLIIPSRQAEHAGSEMLSRIIMKLMAKNAEERYQSIHGLKHDLSYCIDQLQTTGRIRDFEIASKDFSDRFQIPQKLYGRETETGLLIGSFDGICSGGREIMMMTGYEGIGKSALVNEIHKSVIARRGYFISGKFEQFRRNVPYSSIIQAFQQIIRQILTESEERIASWKERMLNAVGPNGQIIIDVIPEIELIIGKQPRVPELPSQESQNRFNTYFRNFIGTFSQEEHPLVIFADDFQWVDMPSLNLIKLFMTDPETGYLLLICAFRENEIDNDHPLYGMLDETEKAGSRISTIKLSNLSLGDVNLLLAETLKCKPEECDELARLCMKKTDGNPFFLKQFLQKIHENKLFEFDSTRMVWRWVLSKIDMMKVTDNVVGLMVDNFSRLPEKTREVLKTASCFGTRFDLKTLSLACGKPAAETANDLWEALREELILLLSDVYTTSGGDLENTEVIYNFSHDRIRNAIYSLIDDREKKRIHLEIGRILKSNADDIESEENILNIVDQLNAGTENMADQDEKNELANLNYLAGRRAKTANAYEIAYQYFSVGIGLLGEKCWQSDYSLTLRLFTEGAEAAFLSGNYEDMEELASGIISNAESILDSIKIYEITIQSFIARIRFTDVLNTAVEILGRLGVDIPKNPSRINVMFSLLRTQLVLSGKKTGDLKNLPEMTDPYKLAAMRILMFTASAAYRGHTLMAVMMGLKMIRLSARYGNSPFSPYAYCLYGIVMRSVLGRIRKGFMFGNLAMDLLSVYKSREYHAKIIVLFNFFLRHWIENLSLTVGALTDCYRLGLETGDFEFAAYCMMYAGVHSLYCGTDLDVVEREMTKNIEALKKLNQERTLNNLRMHREFARNLMGQSGNRTALKGEDFDEEVTLPFMLKTSDTPSLGAYYTDKTLVSFLYGNYPEACRLSHEAEKYREAMMGLVYLPLVYYYTSLAYMSNASCLRGLNRIKYLRRVSLNLRSLKKWAAHAPANHLHKWLLVKAERMRVTGKYRKAEELYKKAIETARKNEYILDEALANELAAKYFLLKGDEPAARSHLKEARYLYAKWGARGKVSHLDEEYSRFLSRGEEKSKEDEDIIKIKPSASDATTSGQIDMETMQKATQAISGEIHLERLLEKLSKILIANAGAEKGFLLLKDGEKLFIEAEAFADREKVNVLHHIPVAEKKDIAMVVINYVLRTKSTVTLNDACNEEPYNQDSYIVSAKPKSIFCMPLIHQNKLSGILYLENNLITGAFTTERVEILKMLTGQIVISIENARLYRNLEEYNKTLEESVAKRTAEISKKNEQLNIQKEELRTALDNLKQSQLQLIQSEKMASLGQLVAGIAHEINNPVNFISAGVDSLHANLEEIAQVLDIYHAITPGNVDAQLKEIESMKTKVDYHEAIDEINRLIESIKNGTRRTTEIVRGLRTFSRIDEDLIKTADITEGIDSTLILLHNKYKERIEIIRKYDDLPLIECYPGQLNQVFMNILSNAIDSIENKGTITIVTGKTSGSVIVSIKDSGRGIPDDLKERIFEPFFTTKDVGKGTGLGLSISHGIIEKHNGSIEVKSEVGKGSEFIIKLPLTQEKG